MKINGMDAMAKGVFLVVLIGISTASSNQEDPEASLTVSEIVRKYGYPFETYKNVVTEDGYLLDLYRIPYGRVNRNGTRPSVLMVHGLTGSGRNFVSLGPKRGLAFILADNGYDVWLANCRGTTVSRKHIALNPDVDKKYWDFSWHEIGFYDLPAMINLIRRVSGNQKISYIGHSQGATTFFVMTSTRQEYNKYVTVAILLAPQAYMRHLFGPYTRLLALLAPFGERVVKQTGLAEFPPKSISGVTSSLTRTVCTMETLQDICALLFFATGGFDRTQLDNRDLPRFVADSPSVAARQGFHYAQNINSGKFRQYNYGRKMNLWKYGSVEPPDYNLHKITAPLALYYANGDWFVDRRDVARLCREVANCAYVYKVPYEQFSHYDYFYAKDVVNLVYNDVIQTLRKFNANCRTTKAC